MPDAGGFDPTTIRLQVSAGVDIEETVHETGATPAQRALGERGDPLGGVVSEGRRGADQLREPMRPSSRQAKVGVAPEKPAGRVTCVRRLAQSYEKFDLPAGDRRGDGRPPTKRRDVTLLSPLMK